MVHGQKRDLLGRPPSQRQALRMLLSPRARRAVTHSGSIGSRIVFARIRGRPFNLFFICAYVSHRGRANPAQSDRYCNLNGLLEKVPRRDAVFLLGDFNSRLQRHAGSGRLVGKCCMRTRTDRGGKQLEKIMEKYRLRAVSTFFQPARGRSPCTYINKVPSLAPSRIDYIIVSELWSTSTRSSKVRWCPSIRRVGRAKYDHGLAAAVIRVGILFQHGLTAERRTERKDVRVLSCGKKERGDEILTRKFNNALT